MKTPHVDMAMEYARGVVAGTVLACRYVKLACQRQLDDLEKSKSASYPYRFDALLAEKLCAFTEKFPHTKGKWARARVNRIRLEPWQCFTNACVFGWVRKDLPLRRFTVAYEEVPRKNAKSTKVACIGLYCFAADNEPGAEIYCGATSRVQALEVFRPAKLMAERTPDFLEHYGVLPNASNLSIPDTGSRFEPVIGKPGDGASPSLAIVDEFHEHATDELVDTMRTGMGAREQPLLYVITTAGDNTAGPCYAMRGDVVKMLEGTAPNEELWGIIYTIDKDDDWTTEEALRKANPNYDVSVDGRWLRGEQRNAINNARLQGTFKTKHLDVWVGSRAGWMNMQAWNALGDRDLSVDDFEGESCYVGVDLSSKVDLTSVMRVFVREVDGEHHYYVFGRHYVPEARADEPEGKHYQQWVTEGYVVATDGEVIDYTRVEQDIMEDDERNSIAELGYDPWGAEHLRQRLEDHGITTVEIPMRPSHFSEPMKWIDALVRAGRIHHDGNEAFNWMMSNVVAREDANDNIYPRKESREKKIDGPVALIMAMNRALAAEGTGTSMYETEDITYL